MSQRTEGLNIHLNGDNEINISFDIEMFSTKEIINLISDYCEIMDLIVTEPTIESIVKDIYKVGL